jgi:molybdopterin-synthase adenylyltransferase
MNDDQLLRYSRQMMLPEIDAAGQERLSQSRVLIIGLGGLGSPVSLYLASAGVGQLVLVDFDKVDLSNLQRQIVHTTKDIDRPKIESAKEHLHAINPDINIECIDHVLEEDELLNEAEKADVIVDTSDNFQTRFALNEVSVKTKTPLVSGAAIRFEGQVTVFNPKDENSPCYRCLYNEDVATEETCTANGVIAPLLGIIGSIQANETLKLLMGIGETLQGRLLLLDSLHMDWNEAKLKKDPACPVCKLKQESHSGSHS